VKATAIGGLCEIHLGQLAVTRQGRGLYRLPNYNPQLDAIERL
jgi:hypothetical protein